MALVTRPLALPQGAAKAAIVNYDGFGLRVVYGYDMNTKKDTVSIDMICGEILRVKYSLGLLDIESAVSSIKEGDTQINFASGKTPEEIYLNYIDTLASDTIDFARYRKLNWS